MGNIISVSDSEIFPNAPLSLVAAEVRYPAVTDSSLGIAVHRSIRGTLDGDWVIHSSTFQTFEVGIGNAGPHASRRSEAVKRIISRDRMRIITIMPDRFTLEVTDYRRFLDFLGLLEGISAAVESVLEPDGISRVGLRYIDEITVPEAAPQWDRWLHSSLIPPAALELDLAPVEWNGAVQYQTASDQVLVLRYGPAPSTVLAPMSLLQRLRTPDGPVFVLDFDSSWQPQEIPAFTAARIVEAADRLHEPARGLFDSLILPCLRDVFRKDLNDT